MRNLSQHSRSQGQDLNPWPSKYEAGVLTALPRHDTDESTLFSARDFILSSTVWNFSDTNFAVTVHTCIHISLIRKKSDTTQFLWVTTIGPTYKLTALMMEAARTSETLVNFYQTTRCYNPEDSNLHTTALFVNGIAEPRTNTTLWNTGKNVRNWPQVKEMLFIIP
jgi:hypothetical protein